jgi:hypothetical protein
VTCRDVSELLSSYLDDELEPEVCNLVENHLRSCDACRAELEELRQVKLALKSLPELEPPPSLHSRVMDAVRDQHRVKKQKPVALLGENLWKSAKVSRRPAWFRRAGLVLAACLVLMLASSAGTMFFARRYGLLDGLSKSRSSGDLRFSSEPEIYGGQAVPPSAPDEGVSAGQNMLSSRGAAPAEEPQASSSEILDLTRKIGPQAIGIERKLIRRADLTLQVSRGRVDAASQEAMHVVRKLMGYIESSSMSVGQGKNQYTTFYMTARVPTDSLDQAIEEISALGEVSRSDTSVQDVTDRYYDLDARIRSKEVQEQRLLQILGNANTVGELLQVEGELSRVRADIESMKGQQNVLEKSSSLSFLSMAIVEEGARKVEPSPWSEIWRVFVNAWKNLLLFAARIAPVAIVVAVVYLVVRKVWFKGRGLGSE